MPERYTITSLPSNLGEILRLEIPEQYQPRYNAAPAQLLPVVTTVAPKGLSYFYWGTIPGWAGNKTISEKIISVRADQLLTRSMYKQSLQSNRCLVPSDGFYVWKKLGKKTRIPYRVQLSDKSTFYFAGIWEEFEDENDQVHHIFKIVLVPSNDKLAEFDDHMPLILGNDESKVWLDRNSSHEDISHILNSPRTGDMDYYTVSPKIENVELDHKGLISEVDSMNQHGNYSLFD